MPSLSQSVKVWHCALGMLWSWKFQLGIVKPLNYMEHIIIWCCNLSLVFFVVVFLCHFSSVQIWLQKVKMVTDFFLKTQCFKTTVHTPMGEVTMFMSTFYVYIKTALKVTSLHLIHSYISRIIFPVCRLCPILTPKNQSESRLCLTGFF